MIMFLKQKKAKGIYEKNNFFFFKRDQELRDSSSFFRLIKCEFINVSGIG